MIYTLKLKAYIDDAIYIADVKPANLYTKPYYTNAKETFIEHHNCMGMDLEEAEGLFAETPFPKVEKWLKKRGYKL